MGQMSRIHAETASERADSAERHCDYLSDVIRTLTDGIPDEKDAEWWAQTSNQDTTVYDVVKGVSTDG